MKMPYSPIEIYATLVYRRCLPEGSVICSHGVERDGNITRLRYHYEGVREHLGDGIRYLYSLPFKPFTVTANFDSSVDTIIEVSAENSELSSAGIARIICAMICIIPETATKVGAMKWLKRVTDATEYNNEEFLAKFYDEYFDGPRAPTQVFRSYAITLGLWEPCPIEYLMTKG